MSAKVSSFEKVTIGESSYLFFLVIWNDYETTIKKELDKHIEKFGENVEELAWIYQSHKKDHEKVGKEVKRKFQLIDSDKYVIGEQIINRDWGELKDRINEEQEPFILIIETDFSDFNPLKDNWAIIWINDYFEDEDSIPKLFYSIQKRLKEGTNLFDYLKSMKDSSSTKSIIKQGVTKGKNNSYQVNSKAFVDGDSEKYLERVKKALSNGKIEQAISYLKDVNTDYSNEVIILSSRYEKISIDKIRDVIGKEEEILSLNKLTSSVLDLVLKIEKEN